MNALHETTDEPALQSSQSTLSLTSSWQQHEVAELQTGDSELRSFSPASSHGDCEFSNDTPYDTVGNGSDDDEARMKNHTDYDVDLKGGGDCKHGEAETTMTLLPPPPSWFQFEDDVSKCLPTEQMQSAKNPGSNKSHTYDSPAFARSSNEVIEDTTLSANKLQKNTTTHDARRREELSSDVPPCPNFSESLQSDAYDSISHPLRLPLLPEKNSPEAQMFDMPPFSFTYRTDNPNQANEESLSDSISLSSAIDTIISQTLTFTSQTLSQTIPTLLHECSSSAIQKALHKLRLEYGRFGPRRYLRASDLGSVGGYFRPSVISEGTEEEDSVVRIQTSVALGKGKDNHFDWMWMDGREVRFTNLPWIERQLVHEWRTYEWSASESLAGDDYLESSCLEGPACDTFSTDNANIVLEHESRKTLSSICSNDLQKKRQSKDIAIHGHQGGANAGEIVSEDDDDEELEDHIDAGEYERARTLAPRPLPRPEWEHASSCYFCHRTFGPTLHRHHCRRCGHSYCNAHSNYFHKLPHLGYDSDVCERVCKGCKVVLDSRDLEERVAWRLARCRDFLTGTLIPYFETGVDTVEDAAFRLTRVAIRLARSIPLGAQAYVAIETVEILRKHGLSGVYGLLLRKEFLAAADLLCRVLGINKKNWPLSVHELSAAIFYALAQHRALRGLRPYGEEVMHSLKVTDKGPDITPTQGASASDSTLKRISSLYAVDENNGGDDEDAGDTIVWEGTSHNVTNEVVESVLDETDVYDPRSENVVDLLLIPGPKSMALNQTRSAEDHNSDDKCETETNSTSEEHDTNPNIELPFQPVCEPVSDDTLSSLLFYAPLALNFIYAECEVDMQLLAAQQGWRLVYAALDQSQLHSVEAVEDTNDIVSNSSDRPASALFAHDDERIACLSVRGTTTIQDVVTDIRAVPVPFPQEEEEEDNEYTTDNAFCDNDEWTSVFRGTGLASCGMASAALNLFRENADSLVYLARKGYKIRIVGHSLGGGVATLLGILMSHHFEKQKIVGTVPTCSSSDDGRLLRVYGYGTPSCVDGRLADYTRAYVTNVVLHDDVVPRLTPTSIRSLLKHLLHIRETWVKAHLSDDLKCYHERAYKVWPTRVRESFTLLKRTGFDKAKRLKKSYKKRVLGSKKLGTPKSSSCVDCGESACIEPKNYGRINANEDGTCEIIDLESTGLDEGMDIEGDLFFDALNDDPLNESDDESSIERSRPQRVPLVPSSAVLVECENDWVPFDEPPLKESNNQHPKETGNDEGEKQQSLSSIDSSPHVLEEFPLPRMFIPGKIVHIYTNCGGYKAAYVPRKFKSLRRISMAGNCLTDHMSKSYYESLLEVKSIRSAKYDLPRWVGFDQDCTCACCASLFTWASTSNTEAQAARDKHNCRACGGLVCDPCSKNKVPIPSIGITQSVRVCDRCYNGWGNMKNDNNAGDNSQHHVSKTSTKFARRSHVVDELAARLPSMK